MGGTYKKIPLYRAIFSFQGTGGRGTGGSILPQDCHLSLYSLSGAKRRQLFLDFNGKASGPNDASPGSRTNGVGASQNNAAVGNGTAAASSAANDTATSPPPPHSNLSLPLRPPSLPLQQQTSSVISGKLGSQPAA